MLVASRTPEGEPNFCPICFQEVCIEPSRPPGDAPCPCCGHLLWFAKLPLEAVWKQTTVRDTEGRLMDLQGNVLDPATGFVDFAATFAIAVEEAALEIEFRYSVPWYRRLWSWVFAALQFRIS